MSVLDPALTRLADAVLIPPFPGPDAPSWVLDALADGLAGVTLFGSNVAAGPERLRALTAALGSAAGDAIIAIDEEGGDVTRLWYASGSPYPGNAALGVVDDPALTLAVYSSMGRDLSSLGVNMDLAPCVDVMAEPANPVIGTRSFGSDPDLVARHGAAAVRGLQSAGLAACVKHFPGHGSTVDDTHESLAVVRGSLDEVKRRDLPPFRAALGAGVKCVMPGHLRVPALTGMLPASLSPEAIALIRSMGFEGVVISDAIEMRAVSDPYGVPGASVLSVAAGVDLLCLGRDVTQQGYLAVRDALVTAVGDGTFPGSRLEEAAARVTALRADLSAAAGAADAVPAETIMVNAAFTALESGQRRIHHDHPGAPELSGGSEVGLAAARRALRMTGDRPVLDHPLVVEIEALPNFAAGQFHWGLSGWAPAGSVMRTPPGDAASDIIEAAAGRSLLLVYRDAHRSEDTRSLITTVLAERPDAILVEMGLPYWQPADAKTYLATYGASRANSQAAAELLGLERVHLLSRYFGIFRDNRCDGGAARPSVSPGF
jgi:beta-N-acetylhexosaminidase